MERLPRGRRMFLHPAVTVRIHVPSPERRRVYAAVFQQGDPLGRDARARLQDEGAQLPEGFRLHVELVDDLDRPYEIVYEEAAAAAHRQAARITLQVLEGSAAQTEYEFSRERINIGRLAEIR
ncbi:MAG TPA: hypothetical protein DEH78_32540, partial [Solibacterales bacterium]|nr:hypothetical protein [Bryobacterales bacterium]